MLLVSFFYIFFTFSLVTNISGSLNDPGLSEILDTKQYGFLYLNNQWLSCGWNDLVLDFNNHIRYRYATKKRLALILHLEIKKYQNFQEYNKPSIWDYLKRLLQKNHSLYLFFTLRINDNDNTELLNDIFIKIPESCHQKIEGIDISESNISKIPNSINTLTNLKYLSIQKNNIAESIFSIEHLTNLKILLANQNKIQEIRLPSLIIFFDISLNKIEKIDLSNMRELCYANFSKNNIVQFYTTNTSTPKLETLIAPNNMEIPNLEINFPQEQFYFITKDDLLIIKRFENTEQN